MESGESKDQRLARTLARLRGDIDDQLKQIEDDKNSARRLRQTTEQQPPAPNGHADRRGQS